MNSIDLEFILVLLILISLILILINKKNIGSNSNFFCWVVLQAKSFFPILIIVLFLRSFVAEPFRIPSG